MKSGGFHSRRGEDGSSYLVLLIRPMSTALMTCEKKIMSLGVGGFWEDSGHKR